MTSLSKAGVPGPNSETADARSQYYGGHIARKIQHASSVLQLDDVLHAHRQVLRPVHLTLAAIQLAKLYRHKDSSPVAHTLQFQRIAQQLEQLAAARAPRLVASQVGNIVFSLSCMQHKCEASSLQALAARIIADDSQRLKLCAEADIKTTVQGFAAQGYKNPIFWQRLGSAVVTRVPEGSAELAAALLLHLPPLQPAPPACITLAAEAAKRLQGQIIDLPKSQVVDLAQHLAKVVQRCPVNSHSTGTVSEAAAAIAGGMERSSHIGIAGASSSALPATGSATDTSNSRLMLPSGAPGVDAVVARATPWLTKELLQVMASTDWLLHMQPSAKQVALLVTALARLTATTELKMGGVQQAALPPEVCDAVGKWVLSHSAQLLPAPRASSPNLAGAAAPAQSRPASPAAAASAPGRTSSKGSRGSPAVGRSTLRQPGVGLQLRHVAGIMSALTASGHRDKEVYDVLAKHSLGLLAQLDREACSKPHVYWAMHSLSRAFMRQETLGVDHIAQLLYELKEQIQQQHMARNKEVFLLQAQQQQPRQHIAAWQVQ